MNMYELMMVLQEKLESGEIDQAEYESCINEILNDNSEEITESGIKDKIKDIRRKKGIAQLNKDDEKFSKLNDEKLKKYTNHKNDIYSRMGTDDYKPTMKDIIKSNSFDYRKIKEDNREEIFKNGGDPDEPFGKRTNIGTNLDKNQKTLAKLELGALGAVILGIGIGTTLSTLHKRALTKALKVYEDIAEPKYTIADLKVVDGKLIADDGKEIGTVDKKTVTIDSEFSNDAVYYGACVAKLNGVGNKYVKELGKLIKAQKKAESKDK